MFVVLVSIGFTVRFKVATESQPATLVKVVDCEPAALNVKPFQVYGSALSQMVVFVVLVNIGFTVKFKVATESQPATEVNVVDCEPAALKVSPFQEYGSALLQIVVFVVLVSVGFTVKLSVATESQPAILVKIVDCEPAALNVSPFQVYGSALSQMVVFVVLVSTGFTVKFSVAIESQPATLVKVVDCEPAALNVNPFQEYGSALSQMVVFVVLVKVGFTVKFSVATESQPAKEVNVVDCEPAALNIKPFQV